MARALIVGFGNPLRSDDGLGWHIAQQLARDLSPSNVEVIATQQLTPEISEAVSRAEQVLFVDAANTGEPGTLQCEQLLPSASPSRHSHDLSPALILMMANELYGCCPPAYLLTIAGDSFEAGNTMSPAVIAAIPAMIAEIKGRIDRDGKSGRSD